MFLSSRKARAAAYNAFDVYRFVFIAMHDAKILLSCRINICQIFPRWPMPIIYLFRGKKRMLMEAKITDDIYDLGFRKGSSDGFIRILDWLNGWLADDWRFTITHWITWSLLSWKLHSASNVERSKAVGRDGGRLRWLEDIFITAGLAEWCHAEFAIPPKPYFIEPRQNANIYFWLFPDALMPSGAVT